MRHRAQRRLGRFLSNTRAQAGAGFEGEHSKLVRQDDLRYRVFWQSNGTERTLGDAVAHQPFRMRFTLNRGQLFAFEVK